MLRIQPQPPFVTVFALAIASTLTIAAVPRQLPIALGRPVAVDSGTLATSTYGSSDMSIMYRGDVSRYRIVQGNETAFLVLAQASCPSGARTFTTPAISVYYGGCSVIGGQVRITLDVPHGEQLEISPSKHALTISYHKVPKFAGRRTFRGNIISRTFFESDASRFVGAQQYVLLKKLSISKTQAAASLEARSELANMVTLPKSQTIGVGSFQGLMAGRQISGVRVLLIARGVSPLDLTILTRVYHVTYDPSSGAVIEYGDELASDDLAQKYGFPLNNFDTYKVNSK